MIRTPALEINSKFEKEPGSIKEKKKTFCKQVRVCTLYRFNELGIPINRVPTSKSCVFCIGMDSFFPTFDSFLVPSC